jgi:methionyl-tRNA formyltransferase
LLLCFCAHVVVPGRILQKLAGRAYNFHPGSPEFPGRTPSDMAVYQGAREFGATAHVMTANVDEGPIVAVKRFRAPEGCTSAQLNALSVRANLRLFQSLVPLILKGHPLPVLQDVRWGSIKSAKRNRLEGRFLAELLSEDEFLRRIRSFGEKGQPFKTVIHGVPFSITITSPGPRLPTPEDRLFTEHAYKGLLRRIKDLGYAFTGYGAAEASDGRRLILHHNARFSVHRAKRLAAIEAERGISASISFQFHRVIIHCWKKALPCWSKTSSNSATRWDCWFPRRPQERRLTSKRCIESPRIALC